MKPASLGQRVAVVALALASGAGIAQAADVQIDTPAGGNFVVKDSTGATTLLQAAGTGPVTIPNLITAPIFSNGVCFDAAGVLGQCGAGAGGLVGPKNMTLSSPGFTSLASWQVLGTDATGGYIAYTIVATDGGSQIATETGTILYNATANSITCTAQTAQKLHLGTVNSGCTPGFFNPGSQPGVSVFDNVTFSSPAPIVIHYVWFEIHNVGGPVTRLEP